jgi:hypothetical protein
MLNPRKLLERLARSLEPKDSLSSKQEWEADPLAHPDLQRMTLERLADLPFERGIPLAGQGSSGQATGPSQESGGFRPRRHGCSEP